MTHDASFRAVQRIAINRHWVSFICEAKKKGSVVLRKRCNPLENETMPMPSKIG